MYRGSKINLFTITYLQDQILSQTTNLQQEFDARLKI